MLAVLVLVGGGITTVVLINGNEKQPQAEEQAPAPADASVVAQKTEPETVNYGDVAVFDACTMMPATLIEEVGYKDAAHGWHVQSYLPRSVPVTAKDQIDALSSCMYEPLDEKGNTRIWLSVEQTPFNSLYRVDGPDKDETALAEVGGVRAFVSPDDKPDSFRARILANGSKVQARVGIRRMADNKEITDYRATFVKLVERVAQNFAKGPQGLTTHVPTGRYESVPNACDVLSSELFQELTQDKDAGPVEGEYYEPEEFKRFENDKNEVRHFYHYKQHCRRLSPEWFGRQKSKGKALKIELDTYRDAEMAVKDAQDCNPNSPSRGITGEAFMSEEKIGDFAACSFMVGNSPTISFVAGRTQVRLTGYGDWAPDDPKEYVKAFTPIAQKTADEVRKAIG